jgi:hypothetical protein
MTVWGTGGYMSGMGSALLARALEGWIPRQKDVLTRMVEEGQLTEGEAFEVAGTLDLLLDKVRAGEITLHFAELVLRKMADEKHAAWMARTGRQR